MCVRCRLLQGKENLNFLTIIRERALRIDRVMGGALGRRYHLLWSFAVPLYTHARGAPRGRGAALQPLVGPAAMLVFAASSEGAGMQAQQSAWLFGLAAVGHVIIAPYWFQWPGSKHGRLAWRRAPVTLMLVLWCVFCGPSGWRLVRRDAGATCVAVCRDGTRRACVGRASDTMACNQIDTDGGVAKRAPGAPEFEHV